MQLPSYHEDVPDHLHGFVVMIPAQLEFTQEAFSLCCFHLCFYAPQVLDYGLLQTIVQLVTKLVDDHVVSISAEPRETRLQRPGALAT